MKYFFILGNNNALSLAELNSVLNLKNPQLLAADFLLAEIDEEINFTALINRLGGTIKLGIIRETLAINTNQLVLVDSAIKMAADKQKRVDEGKFNFGLSTYGEGSFNKKDFGIKIKNYFTNQKISSRFVISRENNLSSVVITQNKLIRKGIEIVAIKSQGNIFLAETLAVQPFKDLSRRDFGRPARDDLSGMLPPKLAMNMLNLVKIDYSGTIIDPFCGSGTIINEAALMGYKNFIASDISKKAIDDAYKNFSWLKDLYNIENVQLKLAIRNVLALSKFVKAESVDAIITEPYLGPQRGKIDFKSIIEELELLYSQALIEFGKVLKKGGQVVMVWPNFYGQRAIKPNYQGFTLKNLLPENLKNSPLLKKSNQGNLIYSRDGQKVFREIIVLEKE